MKDVLFRYATPALTSLFVVSLISGVIIFVHIGPSWLHGVHEWLSLLLAVPFGLHMWRNWRPFINYFKRAAMPFSLAFGVAAVAAFGLVPSGAQGERSGLPQFALAAAMAAATPTTVAPVLGVTPDELIGTLKAAGFIYADAASPMSDMAAAAGKKPADLYKVLNSVGK